MRLVDADALTKKLAEIGSKLAFNDRAVFLAVSMLIANPSEIPTVDAVEVVRCLACKYYQKVYGGVPLGEVGHCICHSFETVPDWFCADGERKEKDEV